MTVSVRSPDRMVEVTVSSEGFLTDLRLNDEIRSRSADRISAQIMTVLRQAQQRLAEQVVQDTTEVMGDSATARAIIASFEQRFPVTREDRDHGH